jgi:Zn-dependent peptidase ImmA (M78 family)
MSFIAVEKAVNAILSNLGDIELPLNIEEVVKSMGITVKPFDLGDDVSGLLAIENGKAVIGINQNESRVRRRFTIAHELGHYELHRDKSNLFVDSQFKIYRGNNSNNTPQKQILEQEANSFAASILMPENLVKTEVKKIAFDLGNEDAIKILSKKFDVSSTAMYIRLSNLNLL